MLKSILYLTAGVLIYCGVKRMCDGPKPKTQTASGGRSFEGKRRHVAEPGVPAKSESTPTAADAGSGTKQPTRAPGVSQDEATAEAEAVFDPQ